MSPLAAMLLRGAVVSGVALLLALALRRGLGASRHAIATLAFAVLLALPFASLLFAPRPVRLPAVSIPTISEPRLSRPRVRELGTRNAPEASSGTPPRSQVGAVAVAIPALLIVYACVAGLLVLRLIVGWGRAAGYARRGARIETRHALDVRVSGEVTVPLALWFGRGVVLLPAAHESWPAGRHDAVLRHEAAHLRRGDLFAAMLARLALALHWPNPLVWALVAEARRAAEDAADEAVLAAGIAPAAYAAHLLDLVAPHRAPAVFALPAVRRPDLSRRIRRMLDPRRLPLSRRSRGLSTLAALVAGFSLFGVAGLAAVVVPVQMHQFELRLQRPGDLSSRSWAADVRNGRSKAATPENGFVGTLADGRQVRVTMVVRRTAKGVEAWTARGVRLKGVDLRSIPILKGRPHTRTIVVRFASNSPTAEAGLGSGPTMGGASVLEFSGGWTKRVGQQFEMYSFVGMPKEDGDRVPFTMFVGDGGLGWTQLAEVSGVVGSKPDTGLMSKIAVSYPVTARPMILDAKGHPFRDENRMTKRREVTGLVSLSFETSRDEDMRQFRIVAVRRDGVAKAPVWTDAGRRGERFSRTYYFQVKPTAMRTFRIESQASRHVELIDVAMKPRD